MHRVEYKAESQLILIQKGSGSILGLSLEDPTGSEAWTMLFDSTVESALATWRRSKGANNEIGGGGGGYDLDDVDDAVDPVDPVEEGMEERVGNRSRSRSRSNSGRAASAATRDAEKVAKQADAKQAAIKAAAKKEARASDSKFAGAEFVDMGLPSYEPAATGTKKSAFAF